MQLSIDERTWEEKWFVLNTLARVTVILYHTICEPQIWDETDGYATLLRGDGETPEGAVKGLFEKILHNQDHRIRIGSYDGPIAFWNGYGFVRG